MLLDSEGLDLGFHMLGVLRAVLFHKSGLGQVATQLRYIKMASVVAEPWQESNCIEALLPHLLWHRLLRRSSFASKFSDSDLKQVNICQKQANLITISV